MNGLINVYKEKGYTSFDVVAKMRGILKERRIGHTGTLDPEAEGVLVLCVGNATKIVDYLTDRRKEYIAEMRLGITTDTEDVTGEILTENQNIPAEDDVKKACEAFVGKIMQIPPMYSAIKVGGRKLVDIAREGGEVERKPREVEIYSIDCEKVENDLYRLRVNCSKGTYIRTLCADIGKKLGCGAAMASLVRTRTGSFTLDDCITVDDLDNMTFEERLKLPKPVESLFADLPEITVPDFYAKLLRGGTPLFQRKLKCSFETGTLLRIRNRGQFIALGRACEIDGEKVIKAKKLFVLEEKKEDAT